MNSKNNTTQTVSARYSDLLGCMKYNRDGGMNTADNAWHDDKYYCKAVEVVTTTADGKTVGLGRNPYEQFCYSVAKKWLIFRDWLPSVARTSEKFEEYTAVVSGTLFECLHNGVEADDIPDKCFAALDASIGDRKDNEYKRMPRGTYEWKAQRAFTATLFTADLSTVGGTEADLAEDSEYGDLSVEDREKLARLIELFNAVKEAHKYATPEKWLCAQCVALNMPTEEGVRLVYGDAINATAKKTAKRAFNSCRVKYARHASEVFGWILDEVENQPEGLDRWVSVLHHCKTIAKATATLEECAVKCQLNDDIVKFLRDQLVALPQSVIDFCEAKLADIEESAQAEPNRETVRIDRVVLVED